MSSCTAAPRAPPPVAPASRVTGQCQSAPTGPATTAPWRDRNHGRKKHFFTHQQAAHPPVSIPAGHRPSARAWVRGSPGRLLYFSAVLPGRPAAVQRGCSTPACQRCPDQRPRTVTGWPEAPGMLWILLFWSGDCTSDALGLCRLPVPAGGDHHRSPLVSAVRAVLPRCRGTAGRARRHRRSRQHLPMGAALHPGVHRGCPAVPSRSWRPVVRR